MKSKRLQQPKNNSKTPGACREPEPEARLMRSRCWLSLAIPKKWSEDKAIGRRVKRSPRRLSLKRSQGLATSTQARRLHRSLHLCPRAFREAEASREETVQGAPQKQG